MQEEPIYAQSYPPHPAYRPEPPGIRRLPVLVGLMIGLLVVLILPSVVEQIQLARTRAEYRAKWEVAREVLGELPEADQRFPLVADLIAPSVVGIETEQVVRGRGGDEWASLFGGSSLWRAQGEGSGVIMDSSGYIITNYHVIGQADVVTVKLADGRTISDVQIVGADPLSDIAVLKIDAADLIAATWGDSDTLEVGDSVLAVGNPFRLAHTVTAGIISAKGRHGIIRDLNYQDFLQTDAAVNPGNSGGPLVNMAGQVVGINTAIYGDRYQGISFAIPCEIAKEVYEKIRATGTVARGWLGVELQEVTEPLAQRLNLKDARGALVTRVLPNAPAAKAGIAPGDVIVKWNGQEVTSLSDLTLAVARTEIGSKVKVELIRDGEPLEIAVTVAQRPQRYSQ